MLKGGVVVVDVRKLLLLTFVLLLPSFAARPPEVGEHVLKMVPERADEPSV